MFSGLYRPLMACSIPLIPAIEVASANFTSMVGAASICYQDPGATSEKEKENDQFGKQFATKFVKRHLKPGKHASSGVICLQCCWCCSMMQRFRLAACQDWHALRQLQARTSWASADYVQLQCCQHAQVCAKTLPQDLRCLVCSQPVR